MLGVGTDRSDEFTSWVRGVLEVGLKDPVVRIANRVKIIEFFMEQIADRRANPRDDDLITELTQGEVDGHPIPDTHILGTCNLMLVAGIDTTWSAIGSSLWHLAQHPEHRAQLRERPEIWPMAIEELLRAYSPVTMARLASKDVEVAGCPIREGDRVLMTFPAANRDPDVFENPDEVILDREHNRHVAFGAGIHRCAGSNLARLELRVALRDLAGTHPGVRARRSRVGHVGWWTGSRASAVPCHLLGSSFLGSTSRRKRAVRPRDRADSRRWLHSLISRASTRHSPATRSSISSAWCPSGACWRTSASPTCCSTSPPTTRRWLTVGQVRPATGQTIYQTDWVGSWANDTERPMLAKVYEIRADRRGRRAGRGPARPDPDAGDPGAVRRAQHRAC